MISFCILFPHFSLKQSFWVSEIVSVSPAWEDPLILWSAFADIWGMFKMHLLSADKEVQLAFQGTSTPSRLLRNQKPSRSFIMILAGAAGTVFVLYLAS